MNKSYDNRLGLKGWAIGGRWGMERYLFTLHRITGLGILLYFMMHILVTTSRIFGEETWEAIMGGFSSPIFTVGEYLVFIAFCFHALNGIRLVLIELGFMVGKPIEPVFPYPTCIGRQRPLTLLLMLVAIVWVVLGGYDLFFMGH